MPNMQITPLRQDLSNEEIVNAIRNDSTPDYQRRIPAATKGSVRDTLERLQYNTPARNEFIEALVNRIGLVEARNTVWTNPIAKFKKGLLAYGDTVEEIQTGLLKAKVYDPNRDYLEREIFGQERPDVAAIFHKVNRQEYYKFTVNEPMLMRAFLEEGGLRNFVTQLMSAPTTSDQWDEFVLMAQLFAEYERTDGFYRVQVPNLATSTDKEADAKSILTTVREWADTLTFVSSHFNPAGMPVAADRDDLELFLTPRMNAILDVEALAGAFNIERSAIPSRTTVIPEEHFNIPGCQGILTTRDFFQVYDTLIDTTTAVNPTGLHTNYFFHHHEIISASKFVPTLMLTTGAGDTITTSVIPTTSVSVVTVQDENENIVTDVQRGEIYEVQATANGSNDAVVFTLAGDAALSPFTRLTQTGVLVVGVDENSEALTITATSVANDQYATSVTIAVNGDKVVYQGAGSSVAEDTQPGTTEA